jgi:AraC-like DNA-binding protein
VKNAHEFNPYVIEITHGTIESQEMLKNRMVMWYELELCTEASEGAGIIMLDQFIPLSPCTLMFRHPSYVAQGVGKFSFIAIRFDAIYDPSLEKYYIRGDDCMGQGFDKKFLNEFYKNSRDFPFLMEIPPVVHLKNDSEISALMMEFLRLKDSQHRDFQIYAKSLLMQLLIKAHDSFLGQPQVLPKSAAVVSSMEFMRSNYMKPLTLDMIAQQVSMSREYFCRLFKSNTGDPPMAYLQHIRIFNAKRLLLTTSMTIEEVAGACGYENVNYFYSVFRKACGVTPTQYRNNIL